ncbi:MAG: ABC transporter permease [Termitinemataceae bacterium]|nr:MAG: ABC transporter permease [Termitinemataceae bacterium]
MHSNKNTKHNFFTKPYFFIALRYLTGKDKKGSRYLLGAASGIALSLIPIMVTLIVTDGMIQGITDRFIELGTGHIQVWPYSNMLNKEAKMTDAKELLESIDTVKNVWEEKQGLGLIVSAKGKTGATVRAVDASFWKEAGSEKYLTVVQGSIDISDRDVLLGKGLAENIGAQVGKTLRIMTVRTSEDGRSIPMTNIFTVKGIISSGYHELDSMWCIVNLEAGEKIFQSGNCYTYLTAKLYKPYRDSMVTAYTIDANIEGQFGIYTWKDLMRSQYSSYESTRQMLLLIMALIVLVASVNVSSATSMLVIERGREIAVLKSFGCEPHEIKSIFVCGSFLTGVCGIIPGTAAGLFLGCNINNIIHGLERFLNIFTTLFKKNEVRILDPGFYLENIPIVVDVKMVVIICIFTIVCALVSSIMPASSAAKTKPIELIRKY